MIHTARGIPRLIMSFLLVGSIVTVPASLSALSNKSLPHMCRSLHKKRAERMPLKNSMMVFDVGDVTEAQDMFDIHIVFMGEGSAPEVYSKNIPEHCVTALQSLVSRTNFQGKLGENCVLTIPHDVCTKHHGERHSSTDKLTRVAMIGLGKHTDIAYDNVEQIRRAVGHAMRVIDAARAYTVALHMPPAQWCDNVMVVAREIVTTMMMASYRFDAHISSKEAPSHHYTITLHGDSQYHGDIRAGIISGVSLGHGVNQARFWSDSPPSVATPRYMAEHAELIAAGSNLTCTVFDHSRVKAMGLGGLAAVSQGATEPCCFVILEYRAPQAAPTVALVGKGVTFDSGGISIKPADRMEEMKHDMSGAAAIMSAMEVIAEMRPNINVVALLPFTENMPSGSATRPGDIVRFYNGLTAEIKNTDAEGRLILADALSYAVKHYQPCAIIDVATLTGSCMAALGKFFAGLMTQHYDLGNRVIESACRSGDRVWVLPLHNDYKPAVKSNVADLANLGQGSYYAGAITAACFLQHFVGQTPWVHLDIAGTAWDVPFSYYSPGATGFGVRLLVDFIMNFPVS